MNASDAENFADVDHSKFSDQGDRANRTKNKKITTKSTRRKKLELTYVGGKAKINQGGTATNVSWGTGFGTDTPKPNPQLSAKQQKAFKDASEEFIRLEKEIAKEKKNPAYKDYYLKEF